MRNHTAKNAGETIFLPQCFKHVNKAKVAGLAGTIVLRLFSRKQIAAVMR
jgi:hypothetical protein